MTTPTNQLSRLTTFLPLDGLKDSLFPTEIWERILFEIAQDPRAFKTVAACSQVCTPFLSLCLQYASSFRIRHIFNQLPPSSTPTPPTQLPQTLSVKDDRGRILAVDDAGKIYRCSAFGTSDLYIQAPDKHGFKSFSLDLEEAFKELRLKQQYGEDEPCITTPPIDVSRLVACHPTSEGFIVVTKGGCSVWKYGAKGPEFRGFYTPFETYGGCETEIYSSSYQNGALLLNVREERRRQLRIIDFKDATPSFSKVKYSDAFTTDMRVGNFSDFGDRRVLRLHDKTFTTSYADVAIQEDHGKKQLVLQKKELEVVCEASAAIKSIYRWPYIFASHPQSDRKLPWLITIHNIEKQEEWLGEEMNLVVPNGDEGELLFFAEEFLFLSYQGSFRAFHLPTKTEHTEKLKPFLQPLLKKNTVLYFANVLRGEGGWTLEAILHNRVNGELTSVTFTPPKAEPPPIEVEEETPPESPRAEVSPLLWQEGSLQTL